MNKGRKSADMVSSLKEQRGVVAIITALGLVALLGFAALAVDIGYLMATRNELQNIADGGALAGARQLGITYEGMTREAQFSYICDPAPIITVVKDVALKNRAAGKNISILNSDIVIGRWNGYTKHLTPTLNQPDAVVVTARRDPSANTSVATFFARMLGTDEVPVTATATAALTGQSTSTPGGIPLPVGISECFFNQHDPNDGSICGEQVLFYPTGESRTGWHTYESSNFNNALLTSIMHDIMDGIYSIPPVSVNETEFMFGGGTLAAVFDDMAALVNTMRVLNDGVIDVDEDSSIWTTSAVVYEDDCGVFNPTGLIRIVGLVTVQVHEVVGPGDPNIPKQIVATIACDYVDGGRGGSANYGTKGSIPGLVQ